MTEFERLLAAYGKGKANLDHLTASVESLLGTSNGAITDALMKLEAAHAAGLPESAYWALRRQLTALSGDSATMLGMSSEFTLDDSTTAMHRGLGEHESPTELNPAAGYSHEEVAKRHQSIIQEPPPPAEHIERPDPTITDMGAAGTGEEPTGTMWPGLYTDSDSGVPEREFQKGEILRGRFELIAKLGEGGMGAVWKGKDLLKEEAKDRNPYVAIKLLQADFKRHPEAFIALQRETSKQQRLAHPNIATVYDFDRDERTQTVFMTMEVMEGQPMDAFIRALPADGLPADDAMLIIEQLAAGLAYAHDNGLVHSDLKPGNCFITHDETVKLLDFGIARASKSKSEAEEGETTLFDPAELGALTPTYATLEMFEGEDPDPRDDIFALAILSYQLLTGRHPYGKKSAPKAKELGLRPARIAKLSKRQNRGLARGLALHRAQRTPTVEQFLDGIRRRHSAVAYAVSVTVATTLLIGALAYKPILDLLNQRQHEDVISALERPGMDNIRRALSQAANLGERELQEIMDDERTRRAVIAHIGQAGDERLDQWLAFVRTFPTEMQREIFDDERARNAIVEHFEARVFSAFDPARRRYDFAAAHQQVNTLESVYPDSASALKIRTGLEARRDNALDRLSDRFNRYLEAGLLVPDQGRRYIGDVLDAVRQMAPTHHLLKDDRLRLRYGELAEMARQANDNERAAALIRAGLAYAPEDPALIDLRYQVQSELTRAANQRRVAEVETRLTARLGQLQSLGDFVAWRDDLLVLAELDPGSRTLAQARARLQELTNTELGGFAAARTTDTQWDQGWRRLLQNAPLLEIEFLRAARERLPDRISVTGVDGRPPTDDARINERVEAIATLLGNPRDDSVWRSALERPFKELLVLLPAEHEILLAQRDRIAEHFLFQARRARRAASFNEALTFIAAGRAFHPGFPPFDLETLSLAQAQAELRARRDAEQLAALIVSTKADFRSKAETNQVQEAKTLLQELRRLGLAESDGFFHEQAPRELADAYARLAATRASREDYAGATSLAQAGLDQWPEHTELRARLAGYTIALENQRFQRALSVRLSEPQPLDVPATAADLARLQASFPNQFADMADELAALRAQAVLEHTRTAQPIGDKVGQQLAAFDALFPARRGRLAPRVAETMQTRILGLTADSIDAIEALRPVIDNIAALAPAERTRLRAALAKTIVAGAQSMAQQDAQAARGVLAAARSILGDQQSLVAAGRALPLPELDAARSNLAAGALSTAARNLDEAEQEDPRHPDIPALRRELESAMQASLRAYADYTADVANAEARAQQQFDDRYTRIVAAWHDNPDFQRVRIDAPRKGECDAGLAGYGARAGGTCYDLVAGRKGPEMVVVPAGDGLDKAYAIGKYEVSVVDFNHYCEQSRQCSARNGAERRLPVTEISVNQAEEYARWLSQEASSHSRRQVLYRLPTAAEWHHAAKADGNQPEQQFNCRVLSAGEVISGHTLLSARSGKQNGWGLANYAGNARELVRNEQTVSVRGGAYNDPLTECGPELGEPHSGEADAETGFRLVRELG